jgi:hypothetical protein
MFKKLLSVLLLTVVLLLHALWTSKYCAMSFIFAKINKKIDIFNKKIQKTLANVAKIYYYIYKRIYKDELLYIFVKFGGYHNDF